MSKSPSKDTTLETRKTLAVKVCSWFQIYCLCVLLHIKQSSILIFKLDHLISFPVSVTIYTDICIVDFMLYLRILVDRSTPFFFSGIKPHFWLWCCYLGLLQTSVWRWNISAESEIRNESASETSSDLNQPLRASTERCCNLTLFALNFSH